MKKNGRQLGQTLFTVLTVFLGMALILSVILFAFRFNRGDSVEKPPVESTGGILLPDDGDDSPEVEVPSGTSISFGTEETSRNNTGTWFYNCSTDIKFILWPLKVNHNTLTVSAEDWGESGFSFLYTPSEGQYNEGDYFQLKFSLTLSHTGTAIVETYRGYKSTVKLESGMPYDIRVSVSEIELGAGLFKITLPSTTVQGATFTVSNIRIVSGQAVDLPMIPLGDFSTKGIYSENFNDVLMDAEGV